MRRRGCLISFGTLAALALLCCLALWFVGLPRLQDTVSDGIRDGLSTEIADQLGGTGATLQPGTHTISMDELEQQLRTSGNTENVDDIRFTAENGRLTLAFGSQGQSFEYTGVPVAENGELQLTDVESTGGGFLERFFPAGKLADAVEGGVNSYFSAQGLDVVGVTAENDQLVIETEASGQ
jgi:hypothetical protein